MDLQNILKELSSYSHKNEIKRVLKKRKNERDLYLVMRKAIEQYKTLRIKLSTRL